MGSSIGASTCCKVQVAMACKVYAHLDVDGRQPFSLPVEINRPEDAYFGNVKETFIKKYADRFPEEAPVEYDEFCFWNQEFCPIPDKSSIAVYAWEHNDFFLRPLPEGAAEASALHASRKERGELSYYYAHDRQNAKNLISKPQTTKASVSTPFQPMQRPVVQAAPAGGAKYNAKQSPFGTDINAYETINSYTWEDHDDWTVKVLVPLDGVGKLSPDQVVSNFGVRSFELLIKNYNGKNLRFACYKTHGEMTVEECKHVVRANRVNLVIKKAKHKDIWFDLFKKKAIGDDDDP